MTKRTDKRKLTSSAVVLCIELEQAIGEGGCSWGVVLSRPGREGTYSRSWTNQRGQLDDKQAEDMAAYITKQSMEAMALWGGVQRTLDG